MFRGSTAHSPPLRKIAFFSTFAALLTAHAGPAHAISLALKGGGVVVSGPIKPGDHIEFREFIASANPRFIVMARLIPRCEVASIVPGV